MCNSTDVTAAVLAQFEALAKTGKPQLHEHTVLAGIALTLPPQESQLSPAALKPGGQGMATADVRLQVAAAGAESTSIPPLPPQQQPAPATPVVVALATGTKCLPASKRDASGRALNDCHAEVCCRRALLRWLYCEMLETVRLYRSGVRDGTAVLQLQRHEQQQQQRLSVETEAEAAAGAAGSAEPGAQEGAAADLEAALTAPTCQGRFPGWQFALRPGVQLHMFVSQPPCGDASIYENGCASHSSGASVDAVIESSADQRDPSAQEHCQQQDTQQQAVAQGLTSSQPRLHLGRTGAKPIKRAKVSHPHQPSSNPSDLPAASPQQGGATDQQPLPPGFAETTAVGVAHNASPAAAAGKAWAVPQAHEVESYGRAQPVGVVRRKPGRGEATLSLSCSDKLARWRLLGLQGSLLSGLLAAPLHLSSITVAISTPSSARHGCGSSSGSPPVVETAVEAPCPASAGPAAATVAAAAVEAAAEAALRRALVERTQPLVGHLPGRFRHALSTLQTRVVRLGITPHYSAATQGGSTSLAAGSASEQVPSPRVRPALASKQESPPAPGRSSVSGGARLSLERLLQLGLVPGGPRRVAGGSTLLWHVPPSTQFLARGGLRAVTCGVRCQAQGQQQQQQEQDSPGTTLHTVKGGTQQAVAGTTGLKLGVSRMGAAAPPAAAAPCVCKEALARLFLEVVGELGRLPRRAAKDFAGGLSPASGGTPSAGGLAAPTGEPIAARTGGLEPGVVASTAGASLQGEELQSMAGQQWESSSYRQLKLLAGAEYQQAWGSLLAAPGSVFEAWIPKPAGLDDFAVG